MHFLSLTGELLGRIDFDKSKIIQPEKLVFVCGGKASNAAGQPASLRELLLERAAARGVAGILGGAKVLLAEDAVRALAESSFGNLLDLEEYIAAVVHAVILIVESPGSMCELGAFIKTDEIRSKLIAILQGEHKNAPSFITNGAIDYLREHCPKAEILSFHWNSEKGVVSAKDYMIDGMLADIPEAMARLREAHATERFDKAKLGHIIYLTLAFCHYLRAAKSTDLKACFSAAKIEISDKQIRRCLDTLFICSFLKPVEKGKLVYYVARVDRAPLDHVFIKGTPDSNRDGMRMVTLIKQAIERDEPFRLDMFRDHHNG